MAKGLRSGIRKAHRTVLRNRVHKPVEDARTQRLHEKLLEVANSAKPDHGKAADEMDVAKTDGAVDAAADDKKDADLNEADMEIDGAAPSSQPKSTKKKLSKKDLRRRKPRNTISFPATRGKGALKPFSESNTRVRKRRYA